MKTSFVSICIPLHRIGEETLYVPVIRLLWKSTSNISNSECSWCLGECGNRDNDWQEVEEDCLIFTFGCESTFKTLHLIFFLNLNRNQVHQNQKKPSEGRKERGIRERKPGPKGVGRKGTVRREIGQPRRRAVSAGAWKERERISLRLRSVAPV